MEKALGQEDIDSLFAAARVKSPTADAAESKPKAELYNFSRAGQISDEQLARGCAHSFR